MHRGHEDRDRNGREQWAPAAVAARAVERVDAHHLFRVVVCTAVDDLPTIAADAVLPGRALGNLIENANKYPRAAASHLDLRVVGDSRDVVFEVPDEGVDVAHDDLPRLFVRSTLGEGTTAAERVPIAGGRSVAMRYMTQRSAQIARGDVAVTSPASYSGPTPRPWLSPTPPPSPMV